MTEATNRWWGDDRALLDEDEARRRLINAAARCIVRRGNAAIRMAEVADEAGVVRSTLYRYFTSREDLLLGLLLSGVDATLDDVVRKLRRPRDAARSIPSLILEPARLIDGNRVNEALFSPESGAFVEALQAGEESVVDVLLRHFGPLLERWRADGQLHEDLDLRETARWINAVSLFLLTPPWRERSAVAKRKFIEQYVIRALVQQPLD